MEEEVSVLTTAAPESSVTTISAGPYAGSITITNTRIDKGGDTGPAIFYVDISVSNLLNSFGSYNLFFRY